MPAEANRLKQNLHDVDGVGLAVVVTTTAKGLLSSSMKDRLVFLRWHHALPGHRAFSVHAIADPRIDFTRLQRACGNKIPTEPKGENSLWYRLYLEVQNVPSVLQVHRDFLLLRDYTGLSVLFLIGLGVAALLLVAPWKTYWIYLGILILQVGDALDRDVGRHEAAELAHRRGSYTASK